MCKTFAFAEPKNWALNLLTVILMSWHSCINKSSWEWKRSKRKELFNRFNILICYAFRHVPKLFVSLTYFLPLWNPSFSFHCFTFMYFIRVHRGSKVLRHPPTDRSNFMLWGSINNIFAALPYHIIHHTLPCWKSFGKSFHITNFA